MSQTTQERVRAVLKQMNRRDTIRVLALMFWWAVSVAAVMWCWRTSMRLVLPIGTFLMVFPREIVQRIRQRNALLNNEFVEQRCKADLDAEAQRNKRVVKGVFIFALVIEAILLMTGWLGHDLVRYSITSAFVTGSLTAPILLEWSFRAAIRANQSALND